MERMAASQPVQLGWKPESAVEWGQRICNGISSHIAEVGQQYESLKSQLRYVLSMDWFCRCCGPMQQIATGLLSTLIINHATKETVMSAL